MRFFEYILNLKGKELEFSRNKRASINSIKGIKIKVPSVSKQNKIVSQVEGIENKIDKLQKELAEIPQQKEEILKKYL